MSGPRTSRPTPRLTALVAVVLVVVGLVATAATASAQAATGRTSAEDPQLTTYPYGIAVRRETNVSTKLAPLPAGYRAAVRQWLERTYTQEGANPECSNTPWLQVRSYHRAGFVSSRQGLFPATGEPDSCAGGGYASIWSNRGGSWREVIKGQEPPSCRALVYHRVPRSMVDGCFDDEGNAVAY